MPPPARPLAYERLVDRLLASPQYGERWGRHWLDVVRFGESQGYETNLPRPAAWPYRDYVIRAFNRDTPFPRFVLEQLAGDAEQRRDWLTQAATGFLVGGTHDIVGNQTIEGMLQQRADDLDDMITATGTTFLGLTIQCARCHDHKFDPIAQTDYYGFQAIFAGVNHAERELAAPDSGEPSARGGRDHGRAGPDRTAPGCPRAAGPARSGCAGPSDGQPPAQRRAVRAGEGPDGPPDDPGDRRRHRALHRRGRGLHGRATRPAGRRRPETSRWHRPGARRRRRRSIPDAAIHKIAHLNDGRHGNGRSWISRVPGKGSVTIAWPEPATIDRVVWGRDREEVYRDRLATEYYVEAALEPGRWQVVASSLDRVPYDPGASAAQSPGTAAESDAEAARERAELIARQAQLRARLAQLGTTFKVYAGTFSQPGPTHLLGPRRPDQEGAEVRPATVAAIQPEARARFPRARGRAPASRWRGGSPIRPIRCRRG